MNNKFCLIEKFKKLNSHSTGNATGNAGLKTDKIKLLKQQLRNEREARIKIQSLSDKNAKGVHMLSDHLEK